MMTNNSSHIQYGTVRVLTQGVAQLKTENWWHAVPSVVWVRCGDVNMVVDPGGDAVVLRRAMDSVGLNPADVTYVFLTHAHLDHLNLLHLFPDAILTDGYSMCQGVDNYLCNDEEWLLHADLSILVVKTPGHCAEHASLLVPTLEDGMVCVAGDLFWWTLEVPPAALEMSRNDLLTLPTDESDADAVATRRSRCKILRLADVIIPGHGPTVKILKP